MHAPTAFLPGIALLITMIPGLPGVIIRTRDDLRFITPGSCRPAPAASGFLSSDRDHGESSSCSGPDLYRRLTCTFNKEENEQKSKNSYDQMHRRRYLWESLGLEAPVGQTLTYTYCFAHHAGEMAPAAEQLPFPYFAGSSTDVPRPPPPEEDLAFALALAGMRSEPKPPAEVQLAEAPSFKHTLPRSCYQDPRPRRVGARQGAKGLDVVPPPAPGVGQSKTLGDRCEEQSPRCVPGSSSSDLFVQGSGGAGFSANTTSSSTQGHGDVPPPARPCRGEGASSRAQHGRQGPQEEGAEFRPRERAAPRGDHHQAQSERRWESASGTTIGTGHIGARRGGRPKVGPYESDPGVDHEAIIRGIQEALLEG